MYKYRILYYSVPVHTVNNGKVSQDLLLYHVPIQYNYEQRGCITRSFTVYNHEKEAVSRDLLMYTTMNKEALSQDLLLYTTMNKEAVSRDLLPYKTMNHVHS